MSSFYGLPKIHKPNAPGHSLPPFRGIISSMKGPTTRASYWLDSILNPLVPQYCGEHWCKDTLHLLREIEKLNENNVFLEHALITIDVVDMYNSIPHIDGITSCRDALRCLTSFTVPQIDRILELIMFVLTNNCFQFKGEFYRQVRGTAMGSPFAPAYANLFMAYLWNNAVALQLPRPVWLKRYLDDIICLIFTPVEVEDILELLNSVHPTTKFTISEVSSSQSFLDVLVNIIQGKLHTDLFSKPTDAHRFIPPTSCHPRHIFRSIVYSGALRIRRICSRDDFFCKPHQGVPWLSDEKRLQRILRRPYHR